MVENPSKFAEDCWWAGVRSVQGDACVIRALKAQQPLQVDYLLAVGKAAASMCRGAVEALGYEPISLVVTKYGHGEEVDNVANVEVIESAHPIPDKNSLAAGKRCLEFVSSVPHDKSLLVLVSGGASALAESLPDGMSLDDLQAVTDSLISEGYDIDQINAVRRQFSLVKGGRLLAGFNGLRAVTYAVSDVPGDDVEVIGSGIGGIGPVPDINFPLPALVTDILGRLDNRGTGVRKDIKEIWRAGIVASNRVARDSAAKFANDKGYEIAVNEQNLHADVSEAARRVAECVLSGDVGVYVFGGEPTVVLPENPGQGGRNQHLALLLARWFRGREDIIAVVGGTDGSDGPTDAAGGIIDGGTWDSCSDPESALVGADAGSALESAGSLFVTGPTGTNVMDLVIVVKSGNPVRERS